MEVDFLLVENDGKTSVYRDEFKIGRLLVTPKMTLMSMAQSKKRKSTPTVRSYDTAVHISADGQRYAVAFSGKTLSASETEELIRNSFPKPLPL